MYYPLLSIKLTSGKAILWTYKNYVSRDSKDVIYILICKPYDNFYLGQTQNYITINKFGIIHRLSPSAVTYTQDFEQRIAKNKSDAKNPHKSTCRISSEYLRDRNQAKRSFQIFPFCYETNNTLRGYKEKRYIARGKPPLNLNRK